MRFHVGFSFRLKNLVKFIIPILIGIGVYFGLPVLFGFIPKVNAQSDYNTYYDMTINEDLSSSELDELHNIVDLQSSYYNIVIMYDSYYFYFVLVPVSSTSYTFNIYSDNTHSTVMLSTLDGFRKYGFIRNFNSETRGYDRFVACYTNDDDCVDFSYSDSNSNTYGFQNQLDNFCYMCIFDDSDYSVIPSTYFYYSNVSLIYSPDDTADSNYLLKSLKINGDIVSPGGSPPTYNDLYDHYGGETPPQPDDSTIVDSIYWFTDNFTEYEVLVNIYILLFLYCISMIVLKLLMIVKGVKW